MFARHQINPELGMRASRINAERSSTTAEATSRRSRQPGQPAMCSCSSSPTRPLLTACSTSASRSQSRLSTEELRQLAPGPEEKRLDALATHADDLRDFRMRRSLSVGQPEDLALLRLEPPECASEVHSTFVAHVHRVHVFGKRDIDAASFLPAAVPREVCGDAEQRVAAMRLAFVHRAGAVEA